MNDIGASWDRRGEFLVNYDPKTKDLNIPCEISIEDSPKKMNSTEIEKIADLFNSVKGSPSKKADIIKAQESVKMGVEATFTHNGTKYKITPLQKTDKEKIAKLKQIATPRKENIHLVTVNPNTPSSKRISMTATLSRSSSSPAAKAPITNAKPVARLPQTSWMRFDRYLGFRQDKKIEHNFFEVRVKDTVITNSNGEIDAIENALSTDPAMKAISDKMRKGNDQEITVGKKTYQLVHVNHSTTPETENQKIFDLVASREKWLFSQIMSGPRPAEIEKALGAAPQTKSETTLRASPPTTKPLEPLRQSISKITTESSSEVSRVAAQIISPTGTVARRAAPIPPATIGKTSSKVLPPLPTPPASRRNSVTSSTASSPKATPPTIAPRLDLWNDKKTTALLDKFILLDVSMKRPIMDKDIVTQILKNHYDKLSRDDRAQFDISLQEDNETIKFGEYSLIRKK